jgi:hypothetical protein
LTAEADATPERYWFSRLDTRDSILTSVYTEPGTLLKLTLSDTVRTNKMLLTNGTPERPLGLGYPVNDQHPVLANTGHHAARRCLDPAGPEDRTPRNATGSTTKRSDNLKEAGAGGAGHRRPGPGGAAPHATARAAAGEALALAARVYAQVEKTQKDVLFGVLFYIALFVPFSFVMERFSVHLRQYLQKSRRLHPDPPAADRHHLSVPTRPSPSPTARWWRSWPFSLSASPAWLP